MTVIDRHHVQVTGTGTTPMIFAHGFGCDQAMWRWVAPAFAERFRVVLFDHIGAGQSDVSAYAPERHASLHGYADDVLGICRELGLMGGVFVGHSVSAMIGLLAAIQEPHRFDELVLIGPSPRYLDDVGYHGGFSLADIEALLELLDSNPHAWSAQMAPTIMGNADRPELALELEQSFCRIDPAIASQFARVTFLSDNRADLPKVRTRALILQSSADRIANEDVGRYCHEHLAGSRYWRLRATGHCPHMSAPEETIAVMRAHLPR